MKYSMAKYLPVKIFLAVKNETPGTSLRIRLEGSQKNTIKKYFYVISKDNYGIKKIFREKKLNGVIFLSTTNVVYTS